MKGKLGRGSVFEMYIGKINNNKKKMNKDNESGYEGNWIDRD